MERYNHHFILNIDDCIGCTRCMRVCPTEAIRIVDGKATLIDNQCVNCGACLTACHVQAFNIIGDCKEQLNNYAFNVAILPIAIYGMVREIEDLSIIYETLYDLGFDAVFDSSMIYELMGEKIEEYLKNHPNKLIILTYCPSVVNLIQLKYPALSKKLIPFDFPSDPAPISWRCMWAWAPAACAICLRRPKRTARPSSSLTRSTPWAASAAAAWAADTTSVSRP